MAKLEETRNAAAFGFVGVDGESVVTPSAGMGDVIGAAADTAPGPVVDNVEDERRVNADGRMETLGGLPGAIADAGDELAVGAGGMKGEFSAVHGDGVARIDHAADEDLQTLDGGIDEADGSAGRGFLAQDVPGLDRLAEFDVDAAMLD